MAALGRWHTQQNCSQYTPKVRHFWRSWQQISFNSLKDMGRAGGKRTWVMVYRIGRQTRRVSIRDASVISTEYARNAAREILSKARLCEDIRALRSQERDRQEITVSAVIEMYVDQYVAVRQKARTQLETKRHLLVHRRDQHERPIHHLAQRDVATGLARIAKDNGPIAAISGLFVWAKRQGLVDQNPDAATAPPSLEKSRSRVLTDQEIALVWQNTTDSHDYNSIIHLLLLTGQRRQEIGEIDFRKKIWILPTRERKMVSDMRCHFAAWQCPFSNLFLERRTGH